MIARRLGRRGVLLGVPALLLAMTGIAVAAIGPVHVGPRPDGTGVATYGWTVTPAGRQVPAGEKPFGLATSPDGRWLLVSNDGQSTQRLQLVDAREGVVKQSLSYVSPQALFVGVAFSPDGRHAYASAGGNDKVRVYRLGDDQNLVEQAPIALPKGSFAAGLAVSRDGGRLWVADNGSDSVSAVDLASGTVLGTVKVGHNPFGVQLSADGRTAHVSNWGGSTISAVDTTTMAVRATITVGTHPNTMARNPVNGQVYVADGDSDEVSVLDSSTDTVLRSIDVSPYPDAPVGSSPDGLAVAPDGQTLYVANAGNNDVAVVRLAGPEPRDRVVGMIPTAWYPTAVALADGGRQLLVANAKGLGAGPNPGGPNPTRPGVDPTQFVGSVIQGTLSIVPVPGPDQLAHYTRQVIANNGFDERDKVRVPAQTASQVIPRRPGQPSPIKHLIYIVKENRTYDQVFGSLGKGDGDPSLNLFGDESAPNHRELARRFVTLDNFYVDGAVSSDGWQWSTGATSNPYNEHLWPVAYCNRGRGDDTYTNVSAEPGRDPAKSRIWDRLAAAGVSFRNYGMWAGGPLPAKVFATEPELAANTDTSFAALDMKIREQSRIDEWQREFHQFESDGKLPAVEFIRLANDHTVGTTPGQPTPRAMVADNDLAVGRVVDTVSHSRYWKDTAILVVEDDAQNGPDHVDAHRTVALAISPYTQWGTVDSTRYSTVSMLRTIELLAGVGPMTQYDAAATPMLNSFRDRPNLRPYDAIVPRQSLDELNPQNAPMAAASGAMDFGAADAAPEQVLNQAIWKSVKGADSAMPAPRHTVQPGPGREPPDDR